MGQLDIMILLMKQQLAVIKRFKRHAGGILDADGKYAKAQQDDRGDSLTLRREQSSIQPDITDDPRYRIWSRFRDNSNEVVREIHQNLEELEALRRSAEQVSNNVSSWF